MFIIILDPVERDANSVAVDIVAAARIYCDKHTHIHTTGVFVVLGYDVQATYSIETILSPSIATTLLESNAFAIIH